MTNEQNERNKEIIKASINDMQNNIISADHWFNYLRQYENVISNGIAEIKIIKEYGYCLINSLVKEEKALKYEAICIAKESLKKAFTIYKEYGDSSNKALIILLYLIIQKNNYIENEQNFIKKYKR